MYAPPPSPSIENLEQVRDAVLPYCAHVTSRRARARSLAFSAVALVFFAVVFASRSR